MNTDEKAIKANEKAGAKPAQALPNRRKFLRGCLISGIATPLGVGALGGGALYYARNIEPGWIDTTYHQMHLTRLTSAFHGYRVVQITDIHADDSFMTKDRLQKIVTMVNQLRPDIIVITGDFVTRYIPGLSLTLVALSQLQAKDGVFGVLGNHDHPAGLDWVRGLLRIAKVQELPNQVHTIQRGDQMLHFIGMDDLWPTNEGTPAPVETHRPLLNQLTSSIPAEGAAILLVHEPDFADVAASNQRIDLQLSGHSHGGQICIPLHGPFFTPALSHKYPSGLYHIENMQLYTNRGLGVLEIPMRFDCRPEIAVIDLAAA
jgi:predicted MPP superfamily phosphohydrolase